MTNEVKIYRISGLMLLSHDSVPEWKKFTKYVRAVSEKDALEKVYSWLGSNHKLKRYHIKVSEIKEVRLEEVKDKRLIDLSLATKLR